MRSLLQALHKECPHDIAAGGCVSFTPTFRLGIIRTT